MQTPITKRVDSIVNTTKYYDDVNDVEIIIGDYNDYSDNVNNVSTDDEIEEKVNPNMYTMMCKNILDKGECKRNKCTFAHTVEQLRPITCKFNNRCVNKKCTFIHTKETKEDYFKRLNLTHLRGKKQVKCYIIRTDSKQAEEDIKIALKTGHKYFTIIIDDIINE